VTDPAPSIPFPKTGSPSLPAPPQTATAPMATMSTMQRQMAPHAAYGYAGRAGARGMHHTPPQTPPYQGTLNGHGGASNAPTLRAAGHQLASGPATLQHHHPAYGRAAGPNANVLGTLGRHQQMGGAHAAYQGLDNLPATMTLGRRGHYAAGGQATAGIAAGPRSSGRGGSRISGLQQHGGGLSEHGEPLLGPNMGQYATLSKQCKTLESSDFY